MKKKIHISRHIKNFPQKREKTNKQKTNMIVTKFSTEIYEDRR